jgi:phosphoserine phosphatase RsbU/P
MSARVPVILFRGGASFMGDTLVPQILVVDDSVIDRTILSRVLQMEGYLVQEARGGKEALEMARQYCPDIILLDVMMPDENGFITCNKLKHDSRTSAIPVIFLSGSDDLKSRIEGLSIGGVDYIIKPFQREEVLARLRIHLRIRQAFDALITQQQNQMRELKQAQRSILVQPEDLPEAHFAVYYRPLFEAGGDFYDVLRLGEGIQGIFTADIGGHGLGAAFITSALKVLLRQNFGPLYTPIETMKLLNGVLLPVLTEGVVLSAGCARLNRRTHRLSFVSAGHPPLIHMKACGEIEVISTESDLLGAFEFPHFEACEISMAEHDRVLFYSDGLIESIHGTSITRQEGLQHLVDTAARLHHLSLEDMVREIALSVYDPEEATFDDILLLGVEF